MDELVIAALRKWPNVPACFGWLALDQRGDFYLRDAAAQAAGPFPAVKGSRIEHRRLLAFIGRNLGHEAGGAWYFQNGPQRVYLELEATPLVAGVQRVVDALGAVRWSLTSHLLDGPWQVLGAPAACWLDELGRLSVTVPVSVPMSASAPMTAPVASLMPGGPAEGSSAEPTRSPTMTRDAPHEASTAAPGTVLALVRSIDMDAAADALEAGAWPAPQEVRFEELLQRHGVQRRPAPQSVSA